MLRQRFARVPLEENLNFPLCLCGWVDMRSELLVAGFTDAQHQPWLTFYNAKVARRHRIESALPFHDYHRRIGEPLEKNSLPGTSSKDI